MASGEQGVWDFGIGEGDCWTVEVWEQKCWDELGYKELDLQFAFD
jgi:hypothetical protein